MNNNNEEVQRKVGVKLKEIRVKAGFSSYEAFAYKYGISRIQYYRMEAGKSNFTIRSLNKILDAHWVRYEDFMKDI